MSRTCSGDQPTNGSHLQGEKTFNGLITTRKRNTLQMRRGLKLWNKSELSYLWTSVYKNSRVQHSNSSITVCRHNKMPSFNFKDLYPRRFRSTIQYSRPILLSTWHSCYKQKDRLLQGSRGGRINEVSYNNGQQKDNTYKLL